MCWFGVAVELSNEHLLPSNTNPIFGTKNEPIFALPAEALSVGIQEIRTHRIHIEMVFAVGSSYPLLGLQYYLLMLELKYLPFSYLVERQLDDYHF